MDEASHTRPDPRDGPVAEARPEIGRIATYTYDLSARVLPPRTGERCIGGITTYAYDASGRFIAFRGPQSDCWEPIVYEQSEEESDDRSA